VTVGDELPYLPEHQLSITAGMQTEQWRINLAANYRGKLRTRADQGGFDPRYSIDSHVVLDLVASRQINEKLAAYVKLDNVLDEIYVAAKRPAGLRPGMPRAAFLGVTYRL
jgi:Fe(3+) dicitrate transport protein